MPDADTPFDRQLGKMGDGGLDAPSFHRNVEPMLEVLRRVLGDAPGHVLEIGSGTGQHIIRYAAEMPAITWWPSDPVPEHLGSIAAWRQQSGRSNIQPALPLDTTAEHWTFGDNEPPDTGFRAVICMNVIHISPWATCLGLMRHAQRWLEPGGRLILYGPYTRGGAHTSPSNAAFDAMLRENDPEWGVRDVADVERAAKERGLQLAEVVEMPANNLTLVFESG